MALGGQAIEGRKERVRGVQRTLSKSFRQSGRLAQLGEHRPYKPGVAGSNPAAPTTVSTKVLTASIYATTVRASSER